MLDIGSPYRPLHLTARADLEMVEHTYRGEKYWVVGDMLALEYYRLNEQEYALLSWLDGKQSLDDIKERFESTFNPYKVSYREIESYLIDFHKKSLLATFTPDQGRHLKRMGVKKRWQKAWTRAKSLLALRWRGINPDAIFRIATPMFGWLFSRWMVVLNVAFMVCALLWFASHIQEAQERMPSAQRFFSSQNWLSLAVVLIGMKIVHEFAHGIVFTKFGGRCHELGVMLLVFMPTLYVNTSDSWRFSDKWKRAAVAGAGIYIELLLASIATFAWWYSKPGPFQFACLNIMVLGSVSSILFNGNPLLKFDGYYLLCDILEIPNLQQRSSKFIRDTFLYYGLGIREGDDERRSTSRTRVWLACYALAAYAFRIFLVYVIAFIVVKLFRPAGLEELAKMFSFIVMSLVIIVPTLALAKYFWIPGRLQRVERGRAIVTLGGGVALLLIFFAVPFPDWITCDFVVEPGNSKTVYVSHDGILKEVFVEPRQEIKRGEPIALLRNLDVELELSQLQGELAEMDREAEMLRMHRYASTREVAREVTLRESRVTAEKRLAELSQIQDSMLLVAPQDGSVIPARRTHAPNDDPDELDLWYGWTLHDENTNASLERGQPICQIGDMEHPIAKLFIDQSDVRFVKVDQPVKLLLDSQSLHAIDAIIDDMSQGNSEVIRSSVTHQHGGKLETERGKRQPTEEQLNSEHVAPASAVFEAMVELPELETPLAVGLHGEARVFIGYRTLAGRMYRFLNKTFRFDL